MSYLVSTASSWAERQVALKPARMPLGDRPLYSSDDGQS